MGDDVPTAEKIQSLLKMKKLLLCALVAAILSPAALRAQEKNAADRSAFWGNEDIYLHKQAEAMFDLIDRTLTENPPVEGAPLVRKLALYNLDALLHETRYDNTEAFRKFLDSRVGKTIAEMAAPVKRGLEVYKIYNDGFVARTRSATIAFDVVRGSCKGQRLIPDSLIRRIVDKCDVLFVTHNHGDHGDPAVVKMFLDAGKPVVAPTEFMPENDRITHIRSERIVDEELTLPDGKLRVKILPGHQGEMMNNIYVVTTDENKTFAHVGDQYNAEDMEWIVDISKHIPRVDVLTVNCWTHRMNDLVNGFAPKITITGHENEMGHTIDHREAFWLTFRKMEKVDRKYAVMGWGERLAM